LRDEEAEIVTQGDVVATDSLEVFADLIDAVGKFCNFDQSLGTKGKLGVVIGSKFPTFAKVDQAAELFCLHMWNHLFFETSEQRKRPGGTIFSLKHRSKGKGPSPRTTSPWSQR
jgi:hypothetical protein